MVFWLEKPSSLALGSAYTVRQNPSEVATTGALQSLPSRIHLVSLFFLWSFFMGVFLALANLFALNVCVTWLVPQCILQDQFIHGCVSTKSYRHRQILVFWNGTHSPRRTHVTHNSKHTIFTDTAVILTTCVMTVHEYFVHFHWNDQF